LGENSESIGNSIALSQMPLPSFGRLGKKRPSTPLGKEENPAAAYPFLFS
jgi:hypothetical protein